ncbi:PAS domain S-box protein [Arcicella rigui]|uniref:histidine kinase n=1 Tax=Arcicella rigui TaxID=797020 RepID=A0ABU5Q687_9BACT|nr:PAS domain S-box protein [Arcicella rigui]MEA5138363.1 PAS domain S-box protein [Arcicella rigui]
MESRKNPSSESIRLSVLKELRILDTPPEQDFDDIVTLASQITGASIALVSLMDTDRQWFKAKIGIDFCEVSKNDSFCQYLVREEKTINVVDATQDERFSNNPFVVGPPYVRFYTGVPIASVDGLILGSVCVLDPSPIVLSEKQVKSLEILARQAESLINKKSALIKSESILSTYVNNTLDSIILIDLDKNIIDCNKVFIERVRKILNKELIKGDTVYNYTPLSIHPIIDESIQKAFSGQEVKLEIFIPFPNFPNWYKTLLIPIKNSYEEITGVVITLTNITEQKEYEKQLQSLNRELSFHQTNSPLAVIKWDKGLTVCSWSEQAENIFGWSADEVVGKSINKLNMIFEKDIESVLKNSELMLSGKISRLTSKNRNYTKSGEVIYCNWHNSILIDESGDIISILSLVENITEVITLTKDLESKKSNYEALINSSDEMVWSIDDQYNFLTLNQATTRQSEIIFGKKDIKEGEQFFDMPMPDCRKNFFKDLFDRVLLGEGISTDLPSFNVNDNFNNLLFDAHLNPIVKKGKIVGVAVSLRNITEKRAAELKLLESEANLKAIFETTDTGYILINNELRVVAFNKVASDISGQNFFNADKIPEIDTPILDYFPEERREILKNTMLQVLNGRRVEYEISFPQPNGTTNWYFVRLYPIQPESKIKYGLVMTLSDISRQKLSEKELEASKERFTLAVRGSSDGIWDWDIARNAIYFSPRFREMLGFSPEVFNEETYINSSGFNYIFDSTHEDDLESLIFAINEHFEYKKPFQHECRFKTKKGDYPWFLIRGQATWDSNQKPVRMAGSLTDITQRKLAEEKLRQSEKMFSDLAKNAPGVVFQLCAEPDGSSYFSYISDKGKGILDIPINDKNWQLNNRIPPKDIATFNHSISKAFSTKSDWNYEGEIILPNGTRMWFQGLASPIVKSNKLIYNGIALDITERKIAEEDRKNLRKLELSLAKEKEINILKSRFISLTSHEFRTPITAIVSSTDLLGIYAEHIPDPVLQQKTNDHINKIIVQTDRLTGMLEDILMLEKNVEGKLKVTPQPVNINKFLIDLNNQYYTDRRDKRKLKMYLGNEYREIITDPSLLIHIVSNLVNNAFKYSLGAAEPELTLSYQPDTFSISIKDYGIGIPLADQEHLFETFFRANNVMNIEGTGLGLAITKEFTEKLGGNISFTSQQDKGSIFVIQFPYRI